MATIQEILDGIDQLRKELFEIRQSLPDDEDLREVKVTTWTKRAYEQLKGWGLSAQAEEGFGRNSPTWHYDGVDGRAKKRADRLEVLRDDIASHPEHYLAVLPTPDQSESASPKHLPTKPHKVFLGHGRSKLWARVLIHLKDELHLPVEAWETESRAGLNSGDILKKALDSATFAVVVVTGEDATADGGKRARQNVIHEIGLFQGRLGFEKVALLEQDGVEEFSNLAGLQVIPFSGERIEDSFYDLGRMLKREGVSEPDSAPRRTRQS